MLLALRSSRTLAVTLLLATLPFTAFAQATDQRLGDVEKKLDAALAEIERLKLGSAAADTTPAYGSRHGFAPAASRVYHSSGGPSIGGYGEMLMEKSDRTRQDGTLSGASARADLRRTLRRSRIAARIWPLPAGNSSPRTST